MSGELAARESKDDATQNAGLPWLGYLRTWSDWLMLGVRGKMDADLEIAMDRLS